MHRQCTTNITGGKTEVDYWIVFEGTGKIDYVSKNMKIVLEFCCMYNK
jgi:hypothetical protein